MTKLTNSQTADAGQNSAKHYRGEHTPGPWSFDEVWHLIYGPSGEEICAVHSAQVDDTARRGDHALVHANAELIASAPALLAERDTLKSDNDRLRAALKAMCEAQTLVSENWEQGNLGFAVTELEAIADEARAALATGDAK